MAVDPLRIFGLLGGQDLAPDEGERPELGRGAEAKAPPPPVAGTLFAERFRIKGSLGEGAFGDVLLATDESLSRDVAIKLLRKTTPQLRARFLREARATASLSHPNILAVFQVGEEDDRPYIVYELVPGARDLTAAFAERNLEGRLDLFEQALSGVAAAHAEGIVHRDLKPENILVQAPGRVYVADFGLAQVSESSLTATGQFMGTPAYMAPEQVLGQETSSATDVWALGQIFYEALYQETWLQDSLTINELISRICAASFAPPPNAPAGIPRALEKLLFQEVLQRRRAQRPPDARTFLERLQRIRNPPPKPAFAPWLFSILVLFAGALGGAVLMGLLRKSLSGEGPTPVASQSPSPSLWPSPVAVSLTPAPPPTPRASLTATLTPTPSLPEPSPSPVSTSVPDAASVSASYGSRTYFEDRRRFVTSSLSELRAGAERGNLAAMRILGRRLFLGWRAKRDVEGGRDWLKRASAAGCPDSMEDLSRSYVHPTAPQDEHQSALWEERALAAKSCGALLRRHATKRTPFPIAEARAALAAGDDECALRIAQFFAALGAKDRALDWTASAIALGNESARGLRAQFEIQRESPDYTQIVVDLEAAARVGSSTALQELARCQMLGKGVPKDFEKAKHTIALARASGTRPADLVYFETLLQVRRSIEERRGEKIVLDDRVRYGARTASHYCKGELALLILDLAKQRKGNAKLRAHAAELFRGAKNSINPQVHVHFGLAIVRKEIQSDDPDREASEAFRRAALLDSPYGYLNWGTALARGLGVAANVSEGVSYLKRAAAAGVVRAHVNLGNLYLNRFRYPKHYDLERGLAAFERAERAGMPHVHRLAGLRFKKEEGLHLEARRLFEIAVKRDDPIAAYHLADYLLSDQGGAPDPERAVKLLEAIPAQHWTASSCNLLADCYARGRGVAADPQLAAMWRAHAERLAKRGQKKGY